MAGWPRARLWGSASEELSMEENSSHLIVCSLNIRSTIFSNSSDFNKSFTFMRVFQISVNLLDLLKNVTEIQKNLTDISIGAPVEFQSNFL